MSDMTIFDDILESKVCDSVVISYDGNYDPHHKYYHGEGMLVINNESKYNGSYSNGLFEGEGSFRWSNGVMYTGNFKKGYMEGSGEYSWPDGSTYSGDIVYCKRQGTGVFTGASGQSYEGTWKNGLRDGTGTLFYNEEKTVSYKGEWKNGLRHGFGTMTYASGNSYEGEWRYGKKCGEGVMIWHDRNEMYIGQWDSDLANGMGEHIWIETPQKNFQRQMCNIYRGMFLNGKRHGNGTFFYANGAQYTGEWSNNSKNGEGCFVHADGSIQCGTFNMDQMVSLSPQSKESDPVSSQYKLNITELLGELPAIDKSPSFPQQSFDIERLILRYNTAIRTLIQKYTDASTDISVIEKSMEKQSGKRYFHPTMMPPASWSKLQNLFFARRDIHAKFFTLCIRQICQFARECDIVGPTMTSYDICMCVKQMHAEHNTTANTRMKLFFDGIHNMREADRLSKEIPSDVTEDDCVTKDVTATNNPAPCSVEVDHVLLEATEGVDLTQLQHIELATPLDYTFESDIYTDMKFPLREREFVEAIVRIIAEASSRKYGGSVPGGGLFDNFYRILAETMEPLSSETRGVPVFVGALYSEAVQTVLFTHEGPLRKLWDQILEIAASSDKIGGVGGSMPGSRLSSAGNSRSVFTEKICRPRVKHIVKLFTALRGTAVTEEGSSVIEILEALNKKGPSGDLSSLDLEVCFDDFVELFCRLVVSNLWIFAPENDSTSQDNMNDPISKDKGNAAIVEAALAKRLSDWLSLI